jgi:selenocysteine lyase/cysteine desulfurase
MINRRGFLGSIAIPAGFAANVLENKTLAGAAETLEAYGNLHSSPEEMAQDEDFWVHVQHAFTVDRSVLNLNNGGVCPATAAVQDAQKRYLDFSNTTPVYSMWRVLEPQRETVRKKLARVFGCDPEEIALTRNASEGLQILQFGFDLNRGDEVLTTNQDYPRMITTWKQRERRTGVVLKQFSIPVPAEDEDEIVARFERNITPRTKLILMCHMINLTGQVLPVKKISQMARKKGIPVLVDGAHTFAHLDFKQEDLDCDFFATSLHKWLFAPHGTGMLYVRRDRIKDIWPLMAASEKMDEDVRKFEEIGTHPAAPYLAIGEAVTFHEAIGAARKEARLRYLRDYWAKQVTRNPKVVLNTSLDPRFSCGLANMRIEGVDSGELNSYLWSEHRILVTTIKHEEFEGIRVTPCVYTTLPELDRFCSVVDRVANNGLPT